MASAFKNAGMTVVTTDTSALLIYIQHQVMVETVIHALYISNKSLQTMVMLMLK